MSPTDDELMQALHEVARKHLRFEGQLSMDTPLIEALELDSMRLLTLIVELENHFGVCLEEGDEDGIVTAGDLLDVLRRRLG